MGPMRLTVVVLNYNAHRFLPACLASLAEDRASGLARVVVVDNASGDGSVDWLRSQDVESILLPGNHGFSAGNNAALERVETDYAMLLNPDTEVRPGALAALVDFMDRTPRCGVAGPRLVDQIGRAHV